MIEHTVAKRYAKRVSLTGDKPPLHRDPVTETVVQVGVQLPKDECIPVTPCDGWDKGDLFVVVRGALRLS